MRNSEQGMTQKQFILSNANPDSASYVLFGIPDDGGTRNRNWGYARPGSKNGPKEIRKASRSDGLVYYRKEPGGMKAFIPNSFQPLDANTISFADSGDVQKQEVARTVSRIVQNKQLSIMLGGDHSHTFAALKGLSEGGKKFAVVYFDAHPDFRSSAEGLNHATSFREASKLPGFSATNSIAVGVRDLEPEEFTTLKQAGVARLTMHDVQQRGMQETVEDIRKKIAGLPVYLSLDLDVVDPAFAPEVSLPTPGGLTGAELLYGVTELARENVQGIDIMEVCPKKGIDPLHRTGILAAKLIIEFVATHSVARAP